MRKTNREVGAEHSSTTAHKDADYEHGNWVEPPHELPSAALRLLLLLHCSALLSRATVDPKPAAHNGGSTCRHDVMAWSPPKPI